MSRRKAPNNPYVSIAFCDERFNRLMGSITGLEKRVDGGFQAVDKKLDQVTIKVEDVARRREQESKETSHFLRNFAAGVTLALLSAAIGYFLH